MQIPQIGHFLFLCLSTLNIEEVMHWELERSFAMPRESSTMQKVMTSLLSTPYQRTKYVNLTLYEPYWIILPHLISMYDETTAYK